MCGRCAAPLIVGYQTTDTIAKGQYIALGTVFTDVSGADIAIKDLFTYAEGTPAGNANVGSADQIWRWNTATASWTKYFYYSGRGITQWRKSGESKETTDVIPGGEGFFFQRAASGTSATLKISAPAK